MAKTITNMWDKISIYCLNHEEPRKMEILSNTEVIKTPFYSCESIHSLEKSNEVYCSNRLNLDDYQGLVLKFLDIVANNGFNNDYTNYRFEYKGVRQKINVKVIRYDDDEIRLGVINTTVLGNK